MFQQHGYKTHEFRSWVATHFSSKIITAEHLLYNTVILAIITFFAEQLTFLSGIIIMTVLTLFWFGPAGKFRSDREKKPLVFTPRVKRLTATLAVLILPLYYFFGGFIFSSELFILSQNIQDPAGNFFTADPYFLGFLLCFVDILIPFLIFPAAWIMKPVENSIQNGFKKQAREKIASMPHLKVIAITGSYGKTSTKFVIDSFLKERLNVCVTPGSYNTPMGICKVINNDLESHHQVLILEMGARYEGNIRELCAIAKPDISVITNVGISHLETFGSREAVAREKSTLARALDPGGTLILNGEDEIVKEMGAERSELKRILIGENHQQVWATNRSVDADGTQFTMNWQNGKLQSADIKTRILGDHHIQNVLLAAAVAREFDIRIETVAIAASNMEPVEHRLELKKQGDLTIIDDAFNSNPVGARNAVDILASFDTGRKIIITPGMIELGDLEEEENRAFGEYIGASGIDLAILVGEEQTQPIREGIESNQTESKPEVRTVPTLFKANDLLSEYARPGDVVLYENDLPDSYNE
ncbi:UDP-N-acetylmuramoyl-tripeptide--D-alanyl-D-alanine ligase [Rhodohalobacter sp. SW132]|uniref:UDP-N-acetylmuramoyl-tripeptide--D-alanyl-D- alanine ligase n=1 Tax=Rhodohalobacter sp. SW132 TaxID=2293433 RepID=UPI001F3164B6|nr:UDP-N-acetylmuramoyl-tripeptide--D-alanyl-D-alanine ligase [Rhodohalobacter sp. SW132]